MARAGPRGLRVTSAGRLQVLDWFAAERLEILDEALKQEDGWGYRHFLLDDTR